MTIANAKWKLADPVDPSVTYKIRGVATDGKDIPPTDATPVSGVSDEIEINNVEATVAFSNQTSYYPLFEIYWKISVDGGDTWKDAGTSQNVIYVCLVGPDSTGYPIPWRSVVHLACSNTGATDANSAFAKTWELFSGPANVKGWDDTNRDWSRMLYYYRKNAAGTATTFLMNGWGSASALLQNIDSTGQCAAWTYLMCDACRLNGATPVKVTATPTGASFTAFLVKHWTPDASPEPWTMWAQNAAVEMIPEPAGGDYGQLTNNAGLPGQNSPTPSEKLFGNHVFLKYNGVYYDPSYGQTYQNELDFQTKAIFGFGTSQGVYFGKKMWSIEKKTTQQVAFTEAPC